MKASRLQEILLEAIDFIKKSDLHLKAVVLDQESTQRMVMKTFFKVCPDEPWLHIPGEPQKIFVVWDFPHLIKNIRNNLRKYDLKVCNN